MTRRRIVVSVMLAVIGFSLAGVLFSQSGPAWKNREEFIRFKQKQSIRERLELSCELLQTEDDSAILTENLNDIAAFSRLKKNDADLVSALDRLAQRKNAEPAIARKAHLVKARILRRNGDPEGEAIFEQAIQSKWADAYPAYWDSLNETGDRDRCALSIYESWLAYRADKDLFHLAGQLLRAKTSNKTASLSRTVFPRFPKAETHPYLHRILEALCAMTDEEYDKCYAILDEVAAAWNATAAPSLSPVDETYREDRNLVLYKALAKVLEGKDIGSAQTDLRQYLAANKENPDKTIERVLNLAWYLEKTDKPYKRILDITTVLMESNWLNTDQKNNLPMRETIGKVYDMHQIGLAWSGQRKEAASWSLKIMTEFYPDTLEGANAAYLYGCYVAREDKESAITILKTLLMDASFDEIVPFVKCDLAYFVYLRGDLQESLAYIQDVVDRVGENPDENYRRCLDKSQAWKNLITKRIEREN